MLYCTVFAIYVFNELCKASETVQKGRSAIGI